MTSVVGVLVVDRCFLFLLAGALSRSVRPTEDPELEYHLPFSRLLRNVPNKCEAILSLSPDSMFFFSKDAEE